MVILKAFKYRLSPNAEQQKLLARHFGCTRVVYNYFLRQRMDYYAQHQGEAKPGLTYTDTARMLTALKRQPDFIWLNEVNSQALQQALMDLDAAYQNFFAGRAQYPQFKHKRDKHSFRVPQGFKLDAKAERLMLPKLPPIRIVLHRPIQGTLRSVTVSRSPSGRYFASLLCEADVPEPTPKAPAKETGLDLGLTRFVTTSDGQKVEAPQYLRRAETKLVRLQRQLARKQPGSHNREKARDRVARLHEKIANQRVDFSHKLSWRLVRENQALYVETLNVKGLLANHRLAKSISDAGWGEFLRQLQYKGGWYGCRVEAVGRFFPSSQLCHRCGFRNDNLTLADRDWDCPVCHTHLDRDVNAARNILAEGQAHAQQSISCRAGTAPTLTPGETCAGKAGHGTRKLAASAVE